MVCHIGKNWQKMSQSYLNGGRDAGVILTTCVEGVPSKRAKSLLGTDFLCFSLFIYLLFSLLHRLISIKLISVGSFPLLFHQKKSKKLNITLSGNYYVSASSEPTNRMCHTCVQNFLGSI
jgi:hypothetical protein